MARLTVSSALAIGVVLASCGGDITSSNEATATLSVVTGPSTDGPLAATAPADSVVVILSGPTDRRVSGVPGESVRIDGLPVGTYTVRLEAYSGSLLIWDGEDTVSVRANATATATIVPNVLEHLPVVTISEPLSDVTAAFDAIVLTGSASDVEDGDLTASIVWSSDQDGPLGTGGSLTPTLSVGVHVISATVQDQAGQSVSAAVTLTSAPVLQPDDLCSENPEFSFASFADSNLESAVRSALSLGPSDDLPCGQLAELTSLQADAAGITDLSGIQNLVGLVDLSLRDNLVTDVGPLSGLSNLTSLDLYANSISDISPLGGLTSLTTLDLGFNQAVEITPLAGLTSLEFLLLEGNGVTDVSPLQGLTSLVALDLGGNPVSEIQPLLDNAGLGSGDEVYLDGTAVSCDDVTALQGKGVTVASDCPGGPTVTITEPSQDTTVTSGDPVTLSGTASDLVDGDLSGSIEWSSDLDGPLGTGSSVSVTLTAGSHTITAFVQDLAGNAASTSVAVTVASNAAPTADAGGPYSGTVDAVIDFDGSGSFDSDGFIASFDWDFGDGTTAIGAGPATSHTYTSTGTFTVTLTVTDDDGATASAMTSVTVSQLVLQPEEFCSDHPSSAIATFTDSNLESAVRFGLGLGSEDDLTCSVLSTLNNLDARAGGVSSLTGAQNLTGLSSADLTNNVAIDDLSPLSGLTGLKTLLLANNAISDLTPLSGLTNLTTLNLESNAIVDITPLSGLSALTELRIPDNEITNVTALSGLTNLVTLTAWRNMIADISPLSDLTNLTELNLGTNQIGDVSALGGLTLLTTLHIDTNQISDISALSGLTLLEELRLHDNQITNIDALTGLTALTNLRLDSNVALNDIQPLLDNAGLGGGDTANLSNTGVSCADIASLEDKGVVVTSDCSQIPTGRIALVNRDPLGIRTLVVMDSDARNRRTVGSNTDVGSPRWCTSGSIYYDATGTAFAQDTELHIIEPDGSGHRVESDIGPGAEFACGSFVSFAFVRKTATGFSVYIAGSFSSNDVSQFTSGDTDFDPAYSPDGTLIAYESGGSIAVENAPFESGGVTGLLTSEGTNGSPAWSPDGSKIAFESDRSGNSDIWIMNADGSNPVQVTSHSAKDEQPAWSPDGNWLAFASDRKGDTSVYVVKVDGSVGPILLRHQAGLVDSHPSWEPN